MNEEQQKPKPTDAVLGGKATPQRAAVLGGIKGLKKRLESSNQQERIIALQQAVNYGDEGLKLVKEASYRDRIILASNPKTPEALLQQLALDKDEKVRREVVSNPNTPEATLQQLGLWAVASNPNISEALLEQLALDEDSGVREGVASNPKTPVRTLLQLAHNEDEWVRKEVASNPNTPLGILEVLATDESCIVREGIMKNPQVSVGFLQRLSQGKKPQIRQFKLQGIARLRRKLDSADPKERIVALQQAANYGEKGLKLVTNARREDKQELAKSSNTPVEILQLLAQDEDWEIRCQVAYNPNCPIKKSQTYVTLIQQTDSDQSNRKFWTVASNPNTETFLELAHHQCALVRSAVARNSQTSFKLLQLLAQDEDQQVRGGVAFNPNTPVALLQQLALDEDRRVRQGVASNLNTPETLLQQLALDEHRLVRDRASQTLREKGLG